MSEQTTEVQPKKIDQPKTEKPTIQKRESDLLISEAILKESGYQTGTEEFKNARRRFAENRKELKVIAFTDKRTGLYNREGFNVRLAEEISKAKKVKELTDKEFQISLVYLDLDGLKDINDTHGHSAGDVYLKKFGELLKRNTRTNDIAARIGGDEFILVLPGTTVEKTIQFWNQRLNPSIESEEIRVSAGVVQLDLDSPNKSIELADESMYKAKELSKQTGKNQIKHGDN